MTVSAFNPSAPSGIYDEDAGYLLAKQVRHLMDSADRDFRLAKIALRENYPVLMRSLAIRAMVAECQAHLLVADTPFTVVDLLSRSR